MITFPYGVKPKSSILLGRHIRGMCKYFYPQGAIIKGEDYIAIYKGKEKLQLNQYVQLKVIMYDDVNMWLIVE